MRPLQRQVAEGVLIERIKVDHKLNYRGEWNNARILRIKVEVIMWITQDDYRGGEPTLETSHNRINDHRWSQEE